MTIMNSFNDIVKGTLKSHMVSIVVLKHKGLSLWVLIWNVNRSTFIPLICPELHCADEVQLSSPMILPFIFSTLRFVLRFPPARQTCPLLLLCAMFACESLSCFFYYYYFNWQNLLNLEIKQHDPNRDICGPKDCKPARQKQSTRVSSVRTRWT